MPVYPLRNVASTERRSDKRLDAVEEKVLATNNRISQVENKLRQQQKDLERLKNDFESNI